MFRDKSHRVWLAWPTLLPAKPTQTFSLLTCLLLCDFCSIGVSKNQHLSNLTIASDPPHSSNTSLLPLAKLDHVSSNCTKCDSIAAARPTFPAPSTTQLQWPHYQNTSRPSFETAFELLNSHSSSNLFSSDNQRDTRSTVIETTVAPNLRMDQGQNDDSSHDDSNIDSASSTITISPNLKSTSVPVRVGFGDFRYPETPDDSHIDDEDYLPEEKSNSDEANIAAVNMATHTSSASYDQHDIDAAFRYNGESPINEQVQDGEAAFGDFSGGHFGDLPQVTRRERILIIGNPRFLPPYPLEGVFTIQQAIPDDFDGCYCDHHYKVSQSASVRHSADNSHHLSPSESSVNGRQNETMQNNPDQEVEVFCYCVGESITQVPRNFSLNVRKMYVPFLYANFYIHS